jgi:hypothetical protein
VLHQRPNTFAQTCLLALSFFLAVGRRTIHIRPTGEHNPGLVDYIVSAFLRGHDCLSPIGSCPYATVTFPT